jgi:8-oxo-dGTP pyrophosphatase MutT (NUDIX family)
VAEPAIAQECVEGYLFVAAPLRLLLLRRPPSRESIWVPVSGKVEPSDIDFRSALLREIREETGFSAPSQVFSLDWEVRFAGPNGAPWRLHAFAVELESCYPPTLSPEHERFEWCSVSEARSRLHYPDNQAAVVRLWERLGLRSEP